MATPFICPGCGKRFRGLTLFDWHRTGSFRDEHPAYGRVCRNAFHLALHGAVTRNGVWTVPMPEEVLAKLR